MARALDDAARRWPEDSHSRPKLLLHLIEEGHRAVIHGDEEGLAGRREAVVRSSGALTGVYGDGYLRQIREEWPA